MKKIVLSVCVVLSTILLCSTCLVYAKEDSSTKKIAPLLKENTIFVAHIDVKKLDVDAIFSQIESRIQLVTTAYSNVAPNGKSDAAKLQAQCKKQLNSVKKEIKKTQKHFLDAKVKDIYVMSVLELLDTCPLIIAVPGNPTIKADVKKCFDELNFQSAGTKNEWTYFVVSSKDNAKSFLKTFDALKSAKRSDIETALALQSKMPIKLVYAPSEQLKSLVKASLPAMIQNTPISAESKDILSVINATEFVSAGFSPAKMNFDVIIQLESEKDAKSCEKLLKSLVNKEFIQNNELGDLLRLIMKEHAPKAKKNQLVFSANEKLFNLYQENIVTVVATRIAYNQELVDTYIIVVDDIADIDDDSDDDDSDDDDSDDDDSDDDDSDDDDADDDDSDDDDSDDDDSDDDDADDDDSDDDDADDSDE
ncbi:MAG: hypothetical protein ACRC2T_01360 [Thermoguttaceae bacterium]